MRDGEGEGVKKKPERERRASLGRNRNDIGGVMHEIPAEFWQEHRANV